MLVLHTETDPAMKKIFPGETRIREQTNIKGYGKKTNKVEIGLLPQGKSGI